MPFKSDSQRRWMYANHPAMAKRWQKETPKGDLPEKVSSYDDTAFSEDPTKMMPRLRQIHKFSEFPTGFGTEDMDAMKQSPGKVKSSQGFEYAETGTNAGRSGYGGPKLWSPGKIKRAAGMVPSMSEQFYMQGMGGAGGGEEVMPLELVSMAGPQAAHGAQMAQMANRLAERPSQRFAQNAAEREADRGRIVQGLARDLERLKMEEAGVIKKPGLLDRIMNKQGSLIPGMPDRAGMATSKSALSALAERTGVPLQQVRDSVRDVKDSMRDAVGSLVPKMEKKGELSPDEKARITKDSVRAHIAPRMLAGSLGGAALGSLVGAATGKGVGVPSLVGTLAGAGLGAIRGAHLGKKQAPERWKAYEHKANKLIDPVSLSRIAEKHGVTDAQARDSLVLGRVRGHSHYPHEGTPGDRMKFMDDWVAADAPTLQKQAYKLQGQTEVQGIPIAIENSKGSVRTGTDSDGNEWRTKMKNPYGYIKGTKGVDGEPVDVYVGPDKEAPNAFVVHQHKDDGKGYDEDKVMLGFPNKAEAKKAYLAHYDDPKFLGPIARVSTERLKELVASKKQLVKISQVSYRAMLDEIMRSGEMQKEAYSLSPRDKAAITNTNATRYGVGGAVVGGAAGGALGAIHPMLGTAGLIAGAAAGGSIGSIYGRNRGRAKWKALEQMEGENRLGDPSRGYIKAAEDLTDAAKAKIRHREQVRALRKAGPAIGGTLGAGLGAVIGAKHGKLLQGAITGLGTGATLGWTPDMALSAKEAWNRYKRVT